MSIIKVILVDDHNLVRHAIRVLLEQSQEIAVAAEADSGLNLMPLIDSIRPDVVILDIVMPGLNGLDTLRQLSHDWPDIRAIILSMYDDEEYVLRAIANGAWGYVVKNSTASDLVQAIFAVLRGEHYLSPILAKRAVEIYFQQAVQGVNNAYLGLTTREREVLQLTAEGHTNTQIAERLSISRRTVEGHRANILRKLNLSSKLELIRYAIRQGIIPSSADNSRSE
jgi:DNA-binding NarL/FixJ family response regulator